MRLAKRSDGLAHPRPESAALALLVTAALSCGRSPAGQGADDGQAPIPVSIATAEQRNCR